LNKNNSVQEWLPFEYIFNNGIIKLKNNSYLKIIKIIPINFNLKSELEKEAILNSYKIFLKTCQFDIQILIQSKKENLSKNISKIQKNNLNEKNNKILNYKNKYINFINEINIDKKSSSKNFFIIIKHENKNNIENENVIFNDLNDKYFKIKECLSRCGNIVYDFQKKEETTSIIKSFINKKEDDKNNKKTN